MSSTRLSLEEVKARESRSRDDELQYFTVETTCLGCRKKLTAQVVELHGKLTCPRCSTVMHMRPDGKWHKGPPPTYILKAPKFTRWQRLCYRFPILRNRVLQCILGTAVLVVIALGLSLALRKPALDLPPQLSSRAGVVAEFILADERAKFRQCIANGTSGEADDWYDQIRARINESRESQLLTSLRGVEVIFENAQEGLANVQITLRSIPTSARAKAQESEYPLILAWKLDEKQGWLLDGTRTLEGMKLGNRP
jgi:hypothetical protein